jgi:hypothetical protein
MIFSLHKMNVTLYNLNVCIKFNVIGCIILNGVIEIFRMVCNKASMQQEDNINK